MSDHDPPAPRIVPGGTPDIGLLNRLIVEIIGRAAGTGRAPNIFTTLARHRSLFRRWLIFAGGLMPGGKLRRVDTELVILRVAHKTGNRYEQQHHERIGATAGLTGQQIAATRDDASRDCLNQRQSLLIAAVDELHAERNLSDELWQALRGELSEAEMIELCMLVGHYEMLATTLATLRVAPDGGGDAPSPSPLTGRRVLITGAARGIGAATARRLHDRGARLVLCGLEEDMLEQVAAECGGALALACDVRDRQRVEEVVEQAVEHLGGLDVVIANAGVAAQLPVVGGNPSVFERTVEVNLLGTYYTLRAAGPHIAHSNGYALAISSLAAAVHPPLLAAYSASKAGVEALADAMRIELAGSGARVGVAYFAELRTDMTSRGFGTEAAKKIPFAARRVTPLKVGINAIERGIVNRSRRVVAPRWVGALLPIRMIAQRVIEPVVTPGIDDVLEVARREDAPLTTDLS
jgi:NAD(P)-dependent dehydrogenase (short-subunit alcohol dehydrogenase family)/alkylhydroperoxidase family enzyme